MSTRERLEYHLAKIDGRGYASYKQIRGRYDLGLFHLSIDHVQVDPYAPPSKARAIVTRDVAALPADLVDTPAKRVAAGDFLTRRFHEALRQHAPAPSGTGNSGTIGIDVPGQQVLARTSVLITDDVVEARFDVGLPASGRRALGHAATKLLLGALPRVVDASLLYKNLDTDALAHHVELYLDQQHLRAQLEGHGLVSFVGDGSILPRRSGDSDLPLTDGIPFTSPSSLRVSFDLPSGRTVTGMGVPAGITVVVGGGYHGKSTLLRAIERGVYPHVGGDGREWVVTRPDAATIRAEDGRAVTGVDISPFISGLPSGADTTHFTSTNASGSTSQAANLVEAVEAGASVLLIDEDTSATNFMIRDERMRRLIAADREPITPFIERIRPLYDAHGISTILIAGGSGAFFDVADQVIALDAYTPHDVTMDAREIARRFDQHEPTGLRSAESVFGTSLPRRVPAADALRPRGKTKPAKARGRTSIQYGKETIDLSAVVQLVDPAQTAAIARILDQLAALVDGDRPVDDVVDAVFRRIDAEGLDALSPHSGHPGDLALPRRHEVHAALNRYRGLRTEQT